MRSGSNLSYDGEPIIYLPCLPNSHTSFVCIFVVPIFPSPSLNCSHCFSHSHVPPIHQMLFVNNKFIRTHWALSLNFTVCRCFALSWPNEFMGNCLPSVYKHNICKRIQIGCCVYSSEHILMSPMYQQQMKIEPRKQRRWCNIPVWTVHLLVAFYYCID